MVVCFSHFFLTLMLMNSSLRFGAYFLDLFILCKDISLFLGGESIIFHLLLLIMEQDQTFILSIQDVYVFLFLIRQDLQ